MQYCELDKFFRSRFEELLNKRTPDSYRVRNHNVLSILEELCELIEGWLKRRILTPETVVLCAEECKKLVEDDDWIDYSFYNKKLLVDDISEYIKVVPGSKEKRESIYEVSSKLKYACRKCIDCNSSVYANKLFSYLIGEINKPGDMDDDGCYVEEMQSFEKAISSLCTELIRLGHSKNHLYLKATRLLNGKFNIEDLKNQLLSQNKTTFEVVYKLQSNKYIHICKEEYGFVDNLDSIKEKLTNHKGEVPYNSFLNNSGRYLFKVFEAEALDTYSAIKKAKDSMALLLDTLYLGNDAQVGRFEPKVLVLSESATGGYYSELRYHDYQLDGTYNSDPEMSKLLKSQVDHILKSMLVKDDAKERLKSALRHFRKANDSNDLESRFVNYWIALEFIFSSPISHETTFSRIKKHLVNVLCCSYISRNVQYLDKLLHEDKILDADKSLAEMSDKEWKNLINYVTNKRTQYRLCKMKSHLQNKENIEEYITSHRKNLEWHIARIYRMRNELIHEAALRQDIEGATSNLRFYLVFVLNQLVSFFHSAKMPVSINDFFHDYENRLNEILLNKERGSVLKAECVMSLIC